MAIKHNGKYKNIAGIEFNFMQAGFVNVMLAVYDNEEDRQKTKTGEEHKVKTWENVALGAEGFNTEKTKDIRENLYKKIKELPEYKDAKDV